MNNDGNRTLQREFDILAFSASSQGRIMIVIGFLIVYISTVSGNLTIITLVSLVSQLKTSMYFFLYNLSILDIIYISSTLPKLLFITYTGDHNVSYNSCLAQMYFFLFCADTECFLLTSMALDRYVAVCKPLHYSLIMNKRTCVLLAIPAWCMGAVNALILTSLIIRLSFCGLMEINNFFCDLKALLSISCSDKTFSRQFIHVDGMCIGVVPFLLILASYISIISSILKIRSSEGRLKAFSSCSSHILIVMLYYGSALCLYMRQSQEGDKYLSVMFVTLVPMLNPLVYSLRNKDIMRAMQQLLLFKKTLTFNIPVFS